MSHSVKKGTVSRKKKKKSVPCFHRERREALCVLEQKRIVREVIHAPLLVFEKTPDETDLKLQYPRIDR